MEPTGVALVTGASRGIGRAVAVELAGRGFDVVATMRDPAAGADLAGRVAEVRALDVTDPTTMVVPDGLRVLVNNAGVDVENLPVEHTPAEAWRSLFETNVFGLIELTRRAIPAMRAAGGGVFVNVTSVSVLVPVPFFAAYRASKAAVSALSESLRPEVAPFGIRVLEVMPGPVATDMLAASAPVPEAVRFPEYAEAARALAAARAGTDEAAVSPAVAARAIVDAVMDDAAPDRIACDPLGTAILAAHERHG